MNISTYESRIKALEDQLNPPTPGGSTGLLSVVVTPDIELSDGTMLNAKLAAMMPIAPNNQDDEPPVLKAITNENLGSYTVTATPTPAWFAIIGDEAADRGEVLSVTKMAQSIQPAPGEGDPHKILQFTVLAADEVDEKASVSWAELDIKITGPTGE